MFVKSGAAACALSYGKLEAADRCVRVRGFA